MARNNRRRSRIDANDLAGYGSVTNGTVNVDRAARGLGVSKTEVRQAIRQAEAAQGNMFYRRISGRREADSTEGASVRGMLQAVFGRGPRGGAVDARAAAQSLGRLPRNGAPLGSRNPAALTRSAGDDTAGGTARHHHQKGRRQRHADFRTSAQGSQALQRRQQDLGQRRTRCRWIRPGLCTRSSGRHRHQPLRDRGDAARLRGRRQ